MECTICCETVQAKKLITCIQCEHACCTTCVRQYLLQSTQDAHCMNCRHQWSGEFVDSVLPASFVNKELKLHRQDVLLERQMAMLPATQPLVEQELQKRAAEAEIEKLREQKRVLARKQLELTNRIDEIWLLNIAGSRQTRTAGYTATRKCPAEGCKGFLDKKMHCGICDTSTCKRCNEVLHENTDDHTCDENTVKSMELLAKDTKPCPTCGCMICKVSGCDQMWCPECKSAFSWRSGTVEQGIVHNPHYYEYLAANPNAHVTPRNMGDFECGGLPHINVIRPALLSLKVVGNVHRLLSHIQRIELPKYRIHGDADTNSDLRISYMLNEIDTNSLKRQIQTREKKRSKNKDIYDILDMFQTVGSEYMRQIVVERGEAPANKVTKYTIGNMQLIIDDIETLRKYTNSELQNIKLRYKNVVPDIANNWYMNGMYVHV